MRRHSPDHAQCVRRPEGSTMTTLHMATERNQSHGGAVDPIIS